MEERDFNREIVPLRDRMFRFAQSLLLDRDEAEDTVHDLLERFGSTVEMFDRIIVPETEK